MSKKVLEQYSNKKEEEIKKFWKGKGIPKKAREQNKKSKKKYYFMDGPPYATGHIHMGTALNKILKDVSMRSMRMQGFDVFDRAGYDTHGVPIENKIEKELDFKQKNDIEKYGVGKFIERCRTFATQYIDVMSSEFEDLGVWMGFEDPYKTLTNEYIEAIWWTFKKAHEKGLLYLGKYPVHTCRHCETALAYNEIEYEKLTDESIYVKFPVKNRDKTFLIVWTTTPWSLPSNAGSMVHPKFDYVEVQVGNEVWILAKELLQGLMNAIEAGYTILKEFKGKELEGLAYDNPLTRHLKVHKPKNYATVVLSERYINLEDGTAIVPLGSGLGKEDFEVATKTGLPIITIMNIDGSFTEEGGKYQGKKGREVDKEIIQDLEEAGLLVYKHPFTHDYPTCWRCKTPLLMLSVPQWFFRVSSIREKMLKENEKVNWVPSWMQDRMKNWIESLSDWPVSRLRYWGTPLPIWLCDKCNEMVVIGTMRELSKYAKVPADLHKPKIDEVTWKCKCGGKMKRVPEVLDVWFDAGVSSWAALGYPQDSKLFKELWPADLNLEGTDQVRGWWNSELITSIICFDKAPFKNILVHGMVLDVSKTKMSKSKGNIVQPKDVIEKYNRDYLRLFMAKESKGDDFAFDWDAFKDINKFFNVFWNSYNFVNMYLNFDASVLNRVDTKGLQAEDLWILSKLNTLKESVVKNYNSYHYPKIVRAIEEFVLNDLSRTYIKLIRKRVGTGTEKAIEKTLSCSIVELLRMLAPLTPHITEYIYQNFHTGKMPESVHLIGMGEANEKLINLNLEKEMDLVMDVVQTALSLREDNKLRLRWPLKEVVVKTKTGKELKNLKSVLAGMCNVEKCTETKTPPKGNYASKEFENATVYLNLDADAGMKEQWELRELTRRIQDARKKAKLHPKDVVPLKLGCSDNAFLEKYKSQIEKETNTKIQKSKGKMEKLLEREFFIEL